MGVGSRRSGWCISPGEHLCPRALFPFVIIQNAKARYHLLFNPCKLLKCLSCSVEGGHRVPN